LEFLDHFVKWRFTSRYLVSRSSGNRPLAFPRLTVLGGIFGYLQAVSEGLGEIINITRISWALVEAERHGLPIASPSSPHRVATKRI
jgi:hypothetical protein